MSRERDSFRDTVRTVSLGSFFPFIPDLDSSSFVRLSLNVKFVSTKIKNGLGLY